MSSLYKSPGVHIESAGDRYIPLERVRTGVCAFLGVTSKGARNEPTKIGSWEQYKKLFGDDESHMAQGVRGFFANGGSEAYVLNIAPPGGLDPVPDDYIGNQGQEERGLRKLERLDDVDLVVAPDLVGQYGKSVGFPERSNVLAVQRAIVAVIYVVGLICVAALRTRHRFDYLEDAYSPAEALLWLGIYLAINLQLSPSNLPTGLRDVVGSAGTTSEYARSFYWTTWVLIWILPPVILARGVRLKDRFVIAVGAIAFILTFVSNKPYLGWPRHTWDPMLLGIVLTGVVLFIRRWLARGPGGVRAGFTAARLAGKDKQWMNAASAALGLITPQSITPSPQTTSEDFRFGGGASGGGGAGGDF